MWFGYAVLGPAIWALLNHLDKYLLGRFFEDAKAAPVLVVFTGFSGFLVATAILLAGLPVRMPAVWQVCVVMLAGALLVSSYMPYMVAMQRGEASIVASLYRLTPLFTFILSYVVLNEGLRPRQILGGLVTVAGSISLIIDLDNRRQVRFDIPTLSLMGAACLVNARIAVMFKYVALQVSFWSAAFWQYIGAGLFAGALSCGVPAYRRTLCSLWHSRQAYVLVPVAVAGELLNLVVHLSVNFAGLKAPLALVSIVTGMHPLFLFAYGIIFTVLFPAFGRDNSSPRQLLNKIVAIGVMCAGIVLTFTESRGSNPGPCACDHAARERETVESSSRRTLRSTTSADPSELTIKPVIFLLDQPGQGVFLGLHLVGARDFLGRCYVELRIVFLDLGIVLGWLPMTDRSLILHVIAIARLDLNGFLGSRSGYDKGRRGEQNDSSENGAHSRVS